MPVFFMFVFLECTKYRNFAIFSGVKEACKSNRIKFEQVFKRYEKILLLYSFLNFKPLLL